MKTKTSLILTVAALALSGSALAEVKIALVAKSLGNGFFEAANVGAQQAAKELGDVKVIYTGPTTTTAEAQIDVLNGLIAQGVDAIAISANDPDAVVPVLKKAMQRGIKVVSWDSGVAPAGRQIHLNPSNNALIGETNVKLAADALQALNVEKGEVAVLSATPTSTNQNIWIEEMKKVLPQYPSVQLVTVAYGDDLSDKSYREAVGLQELLHRNGGVFDAEVATALQRTGNRLREMRSEWERPPHKPVSQQSMAAGAVELF